MERNENRNTRVDGVIGLPPCARRKMLARSLSRDLQAPRRSGKKVPRLEGMRSCMVLSARIERNFEHGLSVDPRGGKTDVLRSLPLAQMTAPSRTPPVMHDTPCSNDTAVEDPVRNKAPRPIRSVGRDQVCRSPGIFTAPRSALGPGRRLYIDPTSLWGKGSPARIYIILWKTRVGFLSGTSFPKTCVAFLGVG